MYFFPAGHRLQTSTESANGFAAGAIAFLVINAFLILVGGFVYECLTHRLSQMTPAFQRIAYWTLFSFFLSFFTAAYSNLVLLALTTIMEVIIVCFLLSTLGRLPYQLEGTVQK